MLNGASGKSRLLHQHYIPVNPKPYVTIVTIVYTDNTYIYTFRYIHRLQHTSLEYKDRRFTVLGVEVLGFRVEGLEFKG